MPLPRRGSIECQTEGEHAHLPNRASAHPSREPRYKFVNPSESAARDGPLAAEPRGNVVMRQLDLMTLPHTSAGAAVARSSLTEPEFLVTANSGGGLTAARWRRNRASMPEPQCLDDHLLSYCASGRAETTILVDGVPTRMHQRLGSITFVPADHPVQWTMNAPAESVHVHIYIPGGAMGMHVQPGADPPPARHPAELRDPWIDSYFRLMIAEYEDCAHGARIDASPFLDETGSLLIRHLQSLLLMPATDRTTRDLQPRACALRPFILKRVEAFVDANLDRNVHLERLADIALMSVGHFLRAFRRATGATPYQYVLERRLNRAGLLLLNSADRVSAIAQRCGFGSAAHFSSIFHAHRGCTPSQYRQGH